MMENVLVSAAVELAVMAINNVMHKSKADSALALSLQGLITLSLRNRIMLLIELILLIALETMATVFQSNQTTCQHIKERMGVKLVEILINVMVSLAKPIMIVIVVAAAISCLSLSEDAYL